MSVYARQIAQAQRLIAKKGQAVTWSKNTSSVPVAGQPWKTDVLPPSTFPVNILFLRKGGSMMNALQHLLKGTDVPEGGTKGLMAAVSFTPEITDFVTRGSVNMAIESIDTVSPNGEAILYFIDFV